MLIDICIFLPVHSSFIARLSGWAAIPGYFRMFSKGISRFCGVDEDEFVRRTLEQSPSKVAEFIEEVSEKRGRPVSDFILTMDEARYDVSVVFSIDQESATGARHLDPEVLAEVVNAYPERLRALMGVDPNKEDAAKSLEHGVKGLGLHGALLCPFLHLLPADDPAC
jgi:predicted TIM-barrel fold metal-dependent hydrolase